MRLGKLALGLLYILNQYRVDATPVAANDKVLESLVLINAYQFRTQASFDSTVNNSSSWHQYSNDASSYWSNGKLETANTNTSVVTYVYTADNIARRDDGDDDDKKKKKHKYLGILGALPGGGALWYIGDRIWKTTHQPKITGVNIAQPPTLPGPGLPTAGETPNILKPGTLSDILTTHGTPLTPEQIPKPPATPLWKPIKGPPLEINFAEPPQALPPHNPDGLGRPPSNPEQPKSEQPKPEQPKPEQPKPQQPKPVPPKPVEPNPQPNPQPPKPVDPAVDDLKPGSSEPQTPKPNPVDNEPFSTTRDPPRPPSPLEEAESDVARRDKELKRWEKQWLREQSILEERMREEARAKKEIEDAQRKTKEAEDAHDARKAEEARRAERAKKAEEAKSLEKLRQEEARAKKVTEELEEAKERSRQADRVVEEERAKTPPKDGQSSNDRRPSKPEPPKPDSPKPESPKPDPPKPESPKPDSPKPDQPNPDAPKPGDPKPRPPTQDRPPYNPYNPHDRIDPKNPFERPGQNAGGPRPGGDPTPKNWDPKTPPQPQERPGSDSRQNPFGRPRPKPDPKQIGPANADLPTDPKPGRPRAGDPNIQPKPNDGTGSNPNAEQPNFRDPNWKDEPSRPQAAEGNDRPLSPGSRPNDGPPRTGDNRVNPKPQEPSVGDPVKPGSPKSEPLKPEPPKPDRVRPKPVHPKPYNPENPWPDPLRPRPKPPKPEVSIPKHYNPENPWPDPLRPRPKPPKPDAPQSNAPVNGEQSAPKPKPEEISKPQEPQTGKPPATGEQSVPKPNTEGAPKPKEPPASDSQSGPKPKPEEVPKPKPDPAGSSSGNPKPKPKHAPNPLDAETEALCMLRGVDTMACRDAKWGDPKAVGEREKGYYTSKPPEQPKTGYEEKFNVPTKEELRKTGLRLDGAVDDAMEEASEGAGKKVKTFWGKVKQGFKAVWDGIVKVWEAVAKAWEEFMKPFKKLWDMIKKALNAFIEWLKGGKNAGGFWGKVAGVFQKAYEGITNSWVWKNVINSKVGKFIRHWYPKVVKKALTIGVKVLDVVGWVALLSDVKDLAQVGVCVAKALETKGKEVPEFCNGETTRAIVKWTVEKAGHAHERLR